VTLIYRDQEVGLNLALSQAWLELELEASLVLAVGQAFWLVLYSFNLIIEERRSKSIIN